MRGKPLSFCLAALCVLAVACGADHGAPVGQPAGRDVKGPVHAAAPSSSAPEPRLLQQFDEGRVGGRPYYCEITSGGHPAGRPAVWVSSQKNDAGDAETVGLGAPSVLCLSGFPKSGPITVTVKAQGRTYTTPLKRVTELTPRGQSDDSLFDGRAMEVTDTGNGLLESGDWRFLPSGPHREAIGLSGRLELTARSGDVTAANAEPLSREPGAATVEGWERSHRIAVYGYPVGARVPIGLYRIKNSSERQRAVLERQIGHVVMPRSRVADFTIPPDAFGAVSVDASPGKDAYCLSVPAVDRCVTQPV
ncbi:hypothetical protein [Streptomyces sp. NPDC088762]|uniref:hypothetical protein n=1 Tax=Streptomyces sp. NPDC088762 TaxID=3365891 RepID=UPI0037FECC0A